MSQPAQEYTIVKEYRIEGREPTIFRVMKNKDNPYVMVDRRPIDNPKLSYKAKGILTYLLSRPDGWEVNVPDLVNHGIDGPAAIRTGLKELGAAGHIKYNPHREGGYIKKWVIEVYEVPNATAQSNEGEEILDDDFRNVGVHLDSDFLQVGNQQGGNRREVLSTLSKKEKKSEATTTTAQPQTQNIFKVYESNIGPLTPLISDALKDLEKSYGPEWVSRAITEAVMNSARNLAYVKGVLKGYAQRGSPDIGRSPVKETRPARVKSNAETNDAIVQRMAQDAANNRR